MYINREWVRHTAIVWLLVFGQVACSPASVREGEGDQTGSSTRVLRDPVVIDWNVKIVKYGTTSGLPPGHAFRVIALSHLSIHDSVNAITPRFQTFISETPGSRTASLAAAAIAAARGTLVRLVPTRSSEIDAEYNAAMAEIPDGTPKDQGIAVGDRVANAVVVSRSNDGWLATVPYTFGSNPGDYQSTPPNLPVSPVLTQLPYVTPLFLTSPRQFRPAPRLSWSAATTRTISTR